MDNKQTIEQQREQLKAQIEALKQENAKLLQAQRSVFDVQISEKGAVSVYGLGRFPVTLYRDQMAKLLDNAEVIRAFMVANASRLKTK